MTATLIKALAWSVLLHVLVMALLWGFYRPTPILVHAQPIAAFVYQPAVVTEKTLPATKAMATTPVERKSLPVKPPVSKSLATKPAGTNTVATKTITAKTIVAKKKAGNRVAMPTSAPAIMAQQQPEPAERKGRRQPVKPQSPEVLVASKVKTASQGAIAPESAPSNLASATKSMDSQPSLAERSLAIATRYEVSSEMLKASQQRPALREQNARSSVKTTPAHVADNVLEVLNDGSFIEKVGDYCYKAKAGADLRADIFSMAPVSCDQDKDAAMYERIMSEVGRNR